MKLEDSQSVATDYKQAHLHTPASNPNCQESGDGRETQWYAGNSPEVQCGAVRA